MIWTRAPRHPERGHPPNCRRICYAERFGGGGVGAKDGEGGSETADGRGTAVTARSGVSAVMCSRVAGATVGSSAAAAPDMSGHQHGAWEPEPCCIDEGIMS